MEKEQISCREAAVGLLDFISKSPSPFHVTANIEKYLKEDGYEFLPESRRWHLQRGGKYYVMRNGSSIAAFQIPQNFKELQGFQMICSQGIF